MVKSKSRFRNQKLGKDVYRQVRRRGTPAVIPGRTGAGKPAGKRDDARK
jgi:hypothetical protein